MALAAIAVFDTVDNKRSWMTLKTLESLAGTVDWNKHHRLFLIDNASCDETKKLYEVARNWLPFTLIENGTNIGTARAINLAWTQRKPMEACLKMDNDVVVQQDGWLDILEECIEREPSLGIIALKRKDLDNNPLGDGWAKTVLAPLSHTIGQKWLNIELTQEAIGTCCLFNPKLLDKVGFLYQPTVYGFDDCLMAVRCEMAGFVSAFYPAIEIDHIDPGGDKYCAEKVQHAQETGELAAQIKADYLNGRRPIYEGPS